jgi:hypothetical protein
MFDPLSSIGDFLSPLFSFKTGDDEFMHLIAPNEMTFTELLVDLIAWIRMPNELNDLYKEPTVSPKCRIACLQERERSPAHVRIF